MANPFYYEETTKDRLGSLAKWFISPSYIGVVTSECCRVQNLVEHISDIVLDLKQGKSATSTWSQKTRYVHDVFIKCSYIFCDDVRQAYRDLAGVFRMDCCPFAAKSAPPDSGNSPGFLFLLHNHHPEVLPTRSPEAKEKLAMRRKGTGDSTHSSSR